MSLSGHENNQDIDVFAAAKPAEVTHHALDAPYPRTLAEIMTVSLVMNDEGEVMMLHDQQFPFYLNWAEFDADRAVLSFVGFQGATIDFGIAVPKNMHKQILKNQQMRTVLVQNHEIVDYYFIPFIKRKTFI